MEEFVSKFAVEVKKEGDVPAAIIAIQTLIQFIENTNSSTLSELVVQIKELSSKLKLAYGTSRTSVASGCDLFVRFITLKSQDMPSEEEGIWDSKNFDNLKQHLVERGKHFMRRLSGSRKSIAHLAYPFIMDGVTVLTTSMSRVVLEILIKAQEKCKKFNVLVTISEPEKRGHHMVKGLKSRGITATPILDSSIGFVMERVDFVLVGAEGVVENGGLINYIGTYPVAVMARSLNKPFYVAVESFKFYRMYPLRQTDLPNRSKYLSEEESEHPVVDYTPPQYINKLFTDLGVLTPSAVSDELIKLYI